MKDIKNGACYLCRFCKYNQKLKKYICSQECDCKSDKYTLQDRVD